MRTLEEMRKDIDRIDNQLVEILEKRMELSKEIGNYKKQNNISIEDKNREEIIISSNSLKIKKEFRNEFEDIYKTIIENSKKIQLK